MKNNIIGSLDVDILGSFLLGILIFVIGFMLGYSVSGDDARDAAVKANVAEYRIDPKTGKRSFVFLSPEAPR